MNGDGFGVGGSDEFPAFLGSLLTVTGWYDSVYDEELGSQPCIFTSVTPVSFYFVCVFILAFKNRPALTAGLE
jgi:hypothetical protein